MRGNERIKQVISFLLALTMILQYIPVSVSAEDLSQVGLCDHHQEHIGCSYVPALEAADCNHQHGDDCYTVEEVCAHVHENCGTEDLPCEHICSETTGCIVQTLSCLHVHDGVCGYAEARDATVCDFVCAECDLQPEESSCDGSLNCEADEHNDSCEKKAAEILNAAGSAAAMNDPNELSDTPEIQTPVISGDWEYTPEGDGACISGYLGSSSMVVIPSELDDYPVTEIAMYTFDGKTTIKSVIIPDTVARIGENAFRNCTALTSVIIQGSPECSREIFSGCASLTSVDLGTIQNIPEGMFCHCSNLTDVCIPDSVVSIGKNAFDGCALSAVDLPESLEFIDEGAFSGCALTSVLLPAHTQIAPNALGWCPELEAIYADADSNLYQSIDGVLYSADGAKLVVYPLAKAGETYAILQGVTTICEAAFQGYADDDNDGSMLYLRNLYMPQSLTKVEKDAYRCTTALNLYFCGDAPAGISAFYQSTKYYAQGRSGWDTSDPTIKQWADADHASQTGALYAPTCGEDGYTLDFCPNCDFTYRNTENGVKATGAHSWSDWLEVSDASHSRTCESCQQEENADHDWDEGSYILAPTPNADGTVKYTCTACDASRTETAEKLSLSGSCGTNLTWTFADGLFTVSGTGAMAAYAENAAPWSDYADCILEIQLGDGVTTIGSYAFSGSVNLTELEIPASVTNIGEGAFTGAAALSEIRFMGAAPVIAEDAFTGVNAAAYYVPTRENWSEETTIDYGGTIAWTVFCTDGHTEAVDEAIPHTCTEPGLTEGRHCTVCREILVAQEVVPAAHNFNSSGECLACGLIAGNCGTELTWTLVEDTLTITGQGAMTEFTSASVQPWKNYRSRIVKVILEEGITSIGKYAFYGCSKLESIQVAASVTVIGNYAFYNCSSMTGITMPEKLREIGEFAFYNCSGLTAVEIPAKVHIIGTSAFMACRNLQSISLPESCTDLGAMAFYSCSSLSGIVLPKKLNALTEQLFGGCTALTTIEIPAAVTRMDSSVFSGCTGLTEIKFLGSAPEIAANAFAGIDAEVLYLSADRSWDNRRADYGGTPTWTPYGSTSGTCGDDVTWYFNESSGLLRFSGSGSIYDYYLPETDEVVTPWRHLIDQVTKVEVNTSYSGSITEISDYCFRGYPNLTTVSLYNVQEMGVGAFQDCPQLTNVTMDSLTAISDSAFSCCTALNRPVLPSTVKSIGQNAFGGCTGLVEMIIPGSVGQIGSLAFQGCTSLKSVSFNGEAPEIAADAFKDVTAEALYRKDDATWTEEVCQNYGGQLTWKQEGISGSCGENLQWSFDEATGTLTISGTGAMTDYTSSYRAPWFVNQASITTLVLEEGITDIGNYAFYHCDAITDLELPEGLTTIGQCAFYYCSALTTVTIPASLREIGSSAFYSCSKITSVYITDLAAWCSINASRDTSNPIYYATGLYLNGEKITQLEVPDTVETIGSYAFAGYEALTSVTIPESVTTIGDDAFYYCTGLKTATLSEGLQTIGRYAFYYAKLTEITIPAGVQTIGSNAFYYNSLTTVTFEGAVADIGSNAFSSNSSLTRVNASSLSDWCATGFADSSANPAAQAKSLYVNGSKITSLTIPEDVSSIGAYCFYNNTAITQVTMPAGVKSIGSNAFGSCSGITKVVAKDLAAWCEISFADSTANPLYKGASLYQSSSKITKLTIPSGATVISDYAFYNAGGITSVSVPDTVTRIGSHAFDSCESIAGITLSNSVTQIGDYAFYFCSGLTSLTVPGSVKTVGFNAFNSCTALTSVVLEDGVQEIGQYAFSGCTKLTSATIPGSVRMVGAYAFSGCTSLAELSLGNGIEILGAYAFNGCSALTSVSIPASITNIGGSAFYNCTGLTGVYITDMDAWSKIVFGNTSANPVYYAQKLYLNNQTITNVVIPEGTETIDAYAFYNCTDLTSITIPASVKTIGRDAFYGCSSLRYVYISDMAAWCGIDFGNEYANPLRYASYFYVNNSLSSYTLTIPQGVEEIGDYAFTGAKHYTVTIPDTVKKIGAYAFYSCSNLSTVTLPEGLESIGAYAFRNDSSISQITIPSTVRNIGSNAFYPCAKLKTVRLPSLENWCSITFGSDHGIFVNATSVYVNGSLTTQLTIPEGIDKVPAYAFDECDVITSATIPEGVELVEKYAFDGCTGLTSVSLPDSLKTISDYAFRNCSKLETVTVPEQVTSIGSYAFYGCSSLVSVNIPEGVTAIPAYTFYNCSALTQITIPSTVTSVGNYAFQGCTSLKTIRFTSDAPTLSSTAFTTTVAAAIYYPVEGSGWEDLISSYYSGELSWLAYSTDSTMPQGSCTDTISWVISGETLTLTGSGAMPDYSSTGSPWYTYRSAVKNVRILGDFTYIGAYNFYGLSGVESIYFADSMPDSFSASAFAGVNTVVRYQADDYTWDPDELGNFSGTIHWRPIGQSEEYIAKGTNWVLDYDGTLTYSGYEAIPDYGSGSAPWYPYRMHLKKLVIDGTMNTIGERAFYGCSKLETVIMGRCIYNIDAYAFAYCTALEKVFLPDYSIVDVEERAFYGCTSLYQLSLPSGCNLGAYAFGGCSALERIYIVDCAYMYNFCGVSTSFDGVTATVYIPEGSSSTSPYNGANGYGGTLTWTVVPYGICGEDVYWSYDETAQKLTVYGSGAPSAAYASGNDVPWAGLQDGILSIEVQDGITYLPSYTFEFCNKATSITLPETLKGIALNTFNDCESLNNLMLPSSLEYFGGTSGWSETFIRCYNLTDVYYLGTEDDWAKIENSANVNSSGSNMTLHFLQKNEPTATCTESGLQAYYTFDDTSVYGSMYDEDGNVITTLATVPALGHRVIAEQSVQIDPLTVSNTSSVPFILTDGTYYSNNKSSNSISQIQITAQYPCSLTLNYGVSSEQNYDKLTILLNDTQKDVISGTVSDKTMTLSLEANDVVIVRYSKDGSVDKNQDKGWVTLGYETITAEPGDEIPAYLVAPDCANAVVCAYCQTVVAEALGHNEVTDEAVDYTCTETGLTEGRHCGRCGEVILAQQEIPASHRVENDVCTMCGIYGTCGDDLTWVFDDSTGTLTVSGSGDMTNFYDDVQPWEALNGQITAVVLEEGVTSLGTHALLECEAMKTLSLPASLADIYEDSLPEGGALEAIVVAENNASYCTEDGVLFTKNKSALMKYPACREDESFTVPDMVTVIALKAFSGCNNLDELIFYGNAPSIDETSFNGTSLTAYYPNNNSTWTADVLQNYGGNITWVAREASGTCGENLTWAFAGNTLTISGTGDMYNYSQTNAAPWSFWDAFITHLVIEEGVTGIGDYAFAGCSVIESASIPSTLVRIGEYAFYRFSRPDGNMYLRPFLAEINQTVRQWINVRIGTGSEGFPGWDVTSFVNSSPIIASGKSGVNVYWELNEDGTMEFFGTGAMDEFWATGSPYGELAVKNVVIGEGITNIGMHIFEVAATDPFAQSLETVTIGSTVERVEEMAFAGCHALKEIWFTGNAPVFVEQCFQGVTATVYYPANTVTWTADVMQNYGGDITWVRYGAVKNRVVIDPADLDGQTTVWIDGTEYAVQAEDDICYVDLPDSSARTMVTYTYNIGSDSPAYNRYPIGMKVWMLSSEDDIYTVTRTEVFDDILQYSGMSIRVTGKKGIRMITSIEKAKKNALVQDGLAGYTLKEYGTVIAWTSQLSSSNPLVLGKSYAKSNYAYKKGVADPVFAYSGSLMQYTNVLVNFSDEQCKNDIALRPYMILEDADGNEVTLYGGIVYRSIGYIAYQNRNVFEPETEEYKYIWNIIQYVYGDVYDDEFEQAWTPATK